MKLESFSFEQAHFDGSNDWKTGQIDLNCLNLIVSKNAVGKSRVLKVISIFAKILKQESPIYWGNWSFKFSNSENSIYDYTLISNSNYISEKLLIDGISKLERKADNAKVFSEIDNNKVDVNPPRGKLVMHVRRDIKEYPYFEELINWADNTHIFKFGNIHPDSFLETDKNKKELSTIEDIPKLINELDKKNIRVIIDEFNKIGYEVEKFFLQKDNFKKEKLSIKENFLKYAVTQNLISQGMFRAFTLLIYINYLLQKSLVSTLIVDDLCEGLDYERATKFGELLFKKMNNENIQFIASTNDSFLMDVVDIKYWNVLKRKEDKIYSYNYHNNKEKFDNFKFTGLSNFDFFSSDYLNEPEHS